jgi:hypothetical protein
MNDHDVFVAAHSDATVVRAAIDTALGATFAPGHGTQPIPTLATCTTLVFFHDRHPLEDDADFAVTRYTYWINIHDSTRNADCHLATAARLRGRDGPRLASHALLRHPGQPRSLPVKQAACCVNAALLLELLPRFGSAIGLGPGSRSVGPAMARYTRAVMSTRRAARPQARVATALGESRVHL